MFPLHTKFTHTIACHPMFENAPHCVYVLVLTPVAVNRNIPIKHTVLKLQAVLMEDLSAIVPMALHQSTSVAPIDVAFRRLTALAVVSFCCGSLAFG